MMEVVLRTDVERLGKRGQVVFVKDGYARNYLIPRGLALLATPGGLRAVEEEKKKNKVKREKEKKEARQLAENISKVSCTVKVKTGEGEKIFGTVTANDIIESLHQEGIELDKKKVVLLEPVNRLGVYQIPIRLHPEVTCNLKLWVIEE